jgi:hypothetical protein
MYEVPAIVGACATCIAPASLIATFAMILIGAIIAVQSERRNQRLISDRPDHSQGDRAECNGRL